MRIVCLSDTHNCNEQIKVPNGDMVVHSGDATLHGEEYEVKEFLRWYSSLPHQYKIFVAGNHDWLFEINNEFGRLLTANYNVRYLQDSETKIHGLKIYGSPWQPRFYDWAFNLNRGSEIAEKWKLIPDDTDILITHGPPNGILDQVSRSHGIEKTGCEELRLKVEQIQPKLHIFGHIHSGYGQIERFGTKFVNASNLNEKYEPTQKPIVVDL